MKCRTKIFLIILLFVPLMHQSALAQSEGQASASTSSGASGGVEIGDDPFELGVFAGAAFPSDRENLAGDAFTGTSAAELNAAGAEVGLRLGLYPIEYFGIEGEGAAILVGAEGDESAVLGAGRGHVVGQLPLGVVALFAVVGGGVVGAECPASGCDGTFSGREADPVFHFGVGAKLGLARHLHVRLDLRDNIASGDHIPEALFGLAFTLGGAEPIVEKSEPVDTDGDGLFDPQDYCPLEAATTANGCPVKDRDGDGKEDAVDQCPDEASELPSGCPDQDPDKDGIPLDADRCPDVAGISPDGCPDPDPDKDGIRGENDQCPEEAEVPNGFEDKDGCPDELPDEVKEFTGTIQGIYFAFGKAEIRQTSFPVLDRAVAVLRDYPDLKLRISGHTDSKGTPERNLELSRERAQAVADYLIGKGIESSRLETVGHGEERPIADNDTEAGRKQNRRIEFEIMQR